VVILFSVLRYPYQQKSMVLANMVLANSVTATLVRVNNMLVWDQFQPKLMLSGPAFSFLQTSL